MDLVWGELLLGRRIKPRLSSAVWLIAPLAVSACASENGRGSPEANDCAYHAEIISGPTGLAYEVEVSAQAQTAGGSFRAVGSRTGFVAFARTIELTADQARSFCKEQYAIAESTRPLGGREAYLDPVPLDVSIKIGQSVRTISMARYADARFNDAALAGLRRLLETKLPDYVPYPGWNSLPKALR